MDRLGPEMAAGLCTWGECHREVRVLHDARSQNAQRQLRRISERRAVAVACDGCRAGDHKAAADCYQLAVDKKPDFTDAMLNLGHALKAVGKEEEAKQMWSKAVTVDPELAGKYFH